MHIYTHAYTHAYTRVYMHVYRNVRSCAATSASFFACISARFCSRCCFAASLPTINLGISLEKIRLLANNPNNNSDANPAYVLMDHSYKPTANA